MPAKHRASKQLFSVKDAFITKDLSECNNKIEARESERIENSRKSRSQSSRLESRAIGLLLKILAIIFSMHEKVVSPAATHGQPNAQPLSRTSLDTHRLEAPLVRPRSFCSKMYDPSCHGDEEGKMDQEHLGCCFLPAGRRTPPAGCKPGEKRNARVRAFINNKKSSMSKF